MDTLIKIICFSIISVNFLNLSLLFIVDLMTSIRSSVDPLKRDYWRIKCTHQLKLNYHNVLVPLI